MFILQAVGSRLILRRRPRHRFGRPWV